MDSIIYKQITSLEEAYEAFHTTVDANYTAVKEQYHKLALINHPDKNGGRGNAFFQHISYAFQFIRSKHEKEMRKQKRKDAKPINARKDGSDAETSYNKAAENKTRNKEYFNARWEESQAIENKKRKEEHRAARAKWEADNKKREEEYRETCAQWEADYEKREQEYQAQLAQSKAEYEELQRSQKESEKASKESEKAAERRARYATKGAMFRD
jgi:curved DNA-binding protein CbpA